MPHDISIALVANARSVVSFTMRHKSTSVLGSIVLNVVDNTMLNATNALLVRHPLVLQSLGTIQNKTTMYSWLRLGHLENLNIPPTNMSGPPSQILSGAIFNVEMVSFPTLSEESST